MRGGEMKGKERHQGTALLNCGKIPVLLLGALAGIALALFLTASASGSGVTMRASTDSTGVQADHESAQPAVSADGRYVAFASWADNLVPGGTDGAWNVFKKDTQTGAIEIVSTSSTGAHTSAGSGNYPCYGSHDSSQPSISAHGRYVAFMSCASDLVPGDTNDAQDIFVKDTVTQEITRVSTNAAGQEANCDGVWCISNSYVPHISADGRYVEFLSGAQNLLTPPQHTNRAQAYVKDRITGQVSVASATAAGELIGADDTFLSGNGRYVVFRPDNPNAIPGHVNDVWDIFVKDMQTGEVTRVNTNVSGEQANGSSYSPSLSYDGRYVVFASVASNLVSQPRYLTGADADIYVKDRQTGQVIRISENALGEEGNSGSGAPSISAHGRYVTFWSSAWNLVSGDTNWVTDVFVKDSLTGSVTRVSTDSMGNESNGTSSGPNSAGPAIAADGQSVAFTSQATNLVPGDTNGVVDIFKAATDAPAAECSRPDLRLSVDSVFWASMYDYTARILSVTYGITNTGTDYANNVEITGSTATNGVTCTTSMPAAVGTILPGGTSSGVTLTYHVPEGVTFFRASVAASADNSCQLGFTYP